MQAISDGHFISSLVRDRYFRFGKTPRIEDYDKYLVGDSFNKLMNAKNLSPKTKDVYKGYIYHFCKSIGLTTDEIVIEYSRSGKYSHKFQNLVEKHILALNEDVDKGFIKAQKVAGARSALHKFSTLNQIMINWDYIDEFVPSIDNDAKDEAYTIEQIKSILECGIDLRLKVAVLFMCSGGLKREAMIGLKDGDVEPVSIDNKLVAARVVAYNENRERKRKRYTTFVTPEAYRTYEIYMSQRKLYEELISSSSPVIIKSFVNGKRTKINNKPIAASTLDGLMTYAAIKAGVREPSEHYNNRYKNKACSAFRKTFESVLLHARTPEGDLKVNPLIAVRLLGDKIKTELRLGTKDLLQPDPSDLDDDYSSLLHEYRKVVPDLTVCDEGGLKEENKNLEIDIEHLNAVNAVSTENEDLMEEKETQSQVILVPVKRRAKTSQLNDLKRSRRNSYCIGTGKN